MRSTARIVADAVPVVTAALTVAATLCATLVGAGQSGSSVATERPRVPPADQRAPQHWRILLGGEGRRALTLYVTLVPDAAGDGYTGTFSNPAGRVIERPITSVYVGEIAFTVTGNPGEYRATLSPDGREATGAFRVDDRSTPLRMERVTAAEVAEAIAGSVDGWRRTALEQSDQIVAALALGPDTALADVGAGSGEWAVTLAERMGPAARVFATEIDPALLADTRQLMAGVGVANVTPILGGPTDTGLPDDCCDAMLLRLVYHEMQEPAPMLASLRRALRPGGTIAVIENPGDGDHDINPGRVIEAFTAAGFEFRRRVEEWDVERQYCLLFTRPR